MAKKPQPFNNPFQALKLPQQAPATAKGRPANQTVAAPPRKAPRAEVSEDDARLFLESVGAVEKVKTRIERVGPKAPPSAETLRLQGEEIESMARLAELVSPDGPFELAESTDFIEGHVPGFDARVLKQLRRGEFAIKGTLDLHGQTREVARPALEQFIQRARVEGWRCAVVVTGKGLHSEGQVPVLRAAVQDWLTRGRLAKQVLAFCTARPEHGGLGAVYVLLRR